MHPTAVCGRHRGATERAFSTLLVLGAGLLSLALSGCASSVAGATKGLLDKVFEEDPTEVVLEFKASADINRDSTGRPSPLSVRLYGLASPGKFETADFFELYDEDERVLGIDIELREEFSFAPGERNSIERELSAKTHYIAVVGAYRDIGGTRWRASTPVEANTKSTIEVQLTDAGVTLVPVK